MTEKSTNFLAGLVLVVPQTMVGALVVRYLYHRLFAPTFDALPQHIGIAQAIGLSFFVGYLTLDESSIANDERPFWERQAGWAINRAIAVLAALVIGWFMP